MGLINLATKFPRYAKVISMGFKSGRMMNAADDALTQADKLRIPTVPYANAAAANLGQADKLESTGLRMMNRAKNLDRVSNNFAAYHNFDASESASLYNDAQKLGQSLNPLLTRAGNIGKPGAGPFSLTSMMPPASYQDAYAPAYGMPATPQLDEEQIRKARRRAEEQAALNQFYAQALTQYQPYN